MARTRTGFSYQSSRRTEPKPHVNPVNLGIGFVPRWQLLVYGIRPAALAGREAYTTKSGERFYWLEDLVRRRTSVYTCEFIIGEIDGAWERCNAPRVKLQYCRFHYQVCHMRVIDPESLFQYLLSVIPLKPKVV